MNISSSKTTKLMVILAAVFTSIALCFLFTQHAKADENEVLSDSAAVTDSSNSVSSDSGQVKLIELTKKYKRRVIWFVPAFQDGTANTYLKDVKFYNANKQEITDITKAIADTSDAGRLTMNRLYTNFIKSSDVNKVPAYVSNSGNEITFYGIMDAKWDDVFNFTNKKESHNGSIGVYKRNSWFYNDILDDDAGIGTIYYKGTKEKNTVSTEGNWVTGIGSCPTLNGVRYSDKNHGLNFYGAYGGKDGGVLNALSDYVWTAWGNSNGPWSYMYVAKDGGMWFFQRSNVNHGVVLTKTF